MSAMTIPRDQIGVVIVDHGSTRDESNRMLEDFAAMFREAGPYRIVEPAHMELAEPSIATAFDRCVARGARLVVVSPYFLGPGKHWYKDIPALAADAATKHPGIDFRVGAPIGLHPMMVDVVRSRVDEAIGER